MEHEFSTRKAYNIGQKIWILPLDNTGWKDEISKGWVLYASGKKPWMHPNGWRGQLVQDLHQKSGGATDGAQNIIIMMRMEEKLTPNKIHTWASRTVSGWLEARVGGKQVHIGTSASIRDIVWWKGKIIVLYWVLFSVVGEYEPWVIAPYVMSPSGYVRRRLVSPMYLENSINSCHWYWIFENSKYYSCYWCWRNIWYIKHERTSWMTF